MFDMFEEEDEFGALDLLDFTSSNEKEETRRTMASPPDERKTGNFAGLLNQGTTCYLNSLLQVLYMTYEFRQKLFELPSNEIGEHERFCLDDKELPKEHNGVKCRRIPIRLRELFAQLQLSNQKAVSTSNLTASFGWENNNIGVQHDITELNRVLIDAIHRSLTDIKGGDSFIPSLFNGVLVNRLVCWGCGNERDKEEIFQDINLQVEQNENILESLQSYVSPTELSGDNKYECENCTIKQNKGKQEARMAISFRTLPPIFTIALSRFGYNWETMERYKIDSTCKFPLVLDLSPYCEANVSRTLRKSVDENCNQDLAQRDLVTIQNEPLMDSVYDPDSFNLYDLTAVVVHTGSAHGGHYFAYIQDRLHEAMSDESEGKQASNWHEFNDDSVRNIPLSSLAKQYGGKQSTAYMLTYIKRTRNPDYKITVPTILQSFIEKQNQKNSELRELYAKEQAMISVEVFRLQDFGHTQSRLFPMYEIPEEEPEDEANENADGNVSDSLFGIFDTEPHANYTTSYKRGIMIRIDGGSKLSELLAKIFSEFENFLVDDVESFRIDSVAWNNGGPVELRDNLSFLKACDMWGSDVKLPECNIENRSKLLLWKGPPVDDVSFSSIISITIIHYPIDNTEPQDHIVKISDNFSFFHFQQKIEEITGIPPSNQYLQKKGKYLTLFTSSNSEETLFALKVADSCVFTCEEIPSTPELSKARQAFDKEVLQLVVTIIDESNCNKRHSEAGVSLTCKCRKDDSVDTLIFQLISLFDLDIHPGSLHLHMKFPSNSGETIRLDERENSLSSYLVTNGTTLILKHQEIIEPSKPEETNIEIQFYEFLESETQETFKERQKLNPRILVVPADSTILSVKQQMIELLPEEHQSKEFRLRRINFAQEILSVLADERKTLVELGMGSTILFCLEEGYVPRIGEISIRCFHYRSEKELCEELSCGNEILLYSPCFFYPRVDSTEELVSVFQFIRQLDDLRVLVTDSLKELKILLSSLVGAVSWKYIRVWSSGRLLTKDNSTIKKNGITNHGAVTFQVLSKSEEISPNESLVMLYKWNSIANDNNSNIDDNNNSGDLVKYGEVVFSSKTPTVEEFLQFVANQADTVPENIVVAKYFYHRRMWMRIEPLEAPEKLIEESAAGNTKKAKRAKQQILQLQNMRKNKFLLSHGDVIVFYCIDERNESQNINNWISKLYADPRVPQKPEKPKSSSNNSYYVGSTFSSKSRDPEQSLSIDIG